MILFCRCCLCDWLCCIYAVFSVDRGFSGRGWFWCYWKIKSSHLWKCKVRWDFSCTHALYHGMYIHTVCSKMHACEHTHTDSDWAMHTCVMLFTYVLHTNPFIQAYKRKHIHMNTWIYNRLIQFIRWQRRTYWHTGTDLHTCAHAQICVPHTITNTHTCMHPCTHTHTHITLSASQVICLFSLSSPTRV